MGDPPSDATDENTSPRDQRLYEYGEISDLEGDTGASEITVDGVPDAQAEELDRAASELFPDEDNIFQMKELLQISYLPDGERIVGRDEYIQTVASHLADATFGGDPENLVLQGRTGTGKSLVAKYVTRLTKWKSDREDGPRTGTAYIDCKTAKTEAKLSQKLGEVLNEEEKTDIGFPDHGLGPDTYFQRLWRVLDELYDVVIIILDEIDKQRDDDEVLTALSRAGEDEHTDCQIGLILISNKSQWVDRLEQRTDSGLQEEEVVFPAYDKEQLTEIMGHRRDAFKEGVLEEDVIPLAAEYAAEEDGDARRALDILRNSGKIARNTASETVTVDHVHKAADQAEKDEVSDLIGDEPPQALATLLATALLSDTTDKQRFSTGTIYSVYRDLVEPTDLNMLSQRRVRDILRDLDFYEIIDSEKESGGYQRGEIATYRLLYDAGIVDEVVCESAPQFEAVRDTIVDRIFDYLPP